MLRLESFVNVYMKKTQKLVILVFIQTYATSYGIDNITCIPSSKH